MEALKFESLHELVKWSVSTEFTKSSMAALVPIVFSAWDAGDQVATRVMKNALDELAEDAICLATKLLTTPGERMHLKMGLTGSLFTESHRFQTEFILRIKGKLVDVPRLGVEVEMLKDSARGAVKMISGFDFTAEKKLIEKWESKIPSLSETELRELVLPIRTALSPTECRNPKSKDLDKMGVNAAMEVWLEEESSIYSQISLQKPVLERVILRVTKAFQNGGQLFYAGAGTSGRLGILDASECPPTFQSPPHWVQGLPNHASIINCCNTRNSIISSFFRNYFRR